MTEEIRETDSLLATEVAREGEPSSSEAAGTSGSSSGVSSAEDKKEEGAMVTFTAQQVYRSGEGEEHNVSFSFKDSLQIFPILQLFSSFPTIHEKHIVMKSPFNTSVIRMMSIVQLFLRGIEIGPVSDKWCGDVYNFNCYDLNGLKRILQSVSDYEFIMIFKCALFYENSLVERVMSRLFAHRMLGFDNRLIAFRQMFGFVPPMHLTEEFDFLSLYSKCVEKYQSFVFHKSQNQFYNMNKNGDFCNGQTGRWDPCTKQKYKRVFRRKIVFCGQHECEKTLVGKMISGKGKTFTDRLLSKPLKRKHDGDDDTE